MSTPMMQQWEACKKKAKDAVLLFRLGDFYEAFYEDAEVLSKELELTLTQRQGVPMSGVPYHSIDKYLDKLTEKGFIVAIAEQVEDPKETKGIVKREVTEVVSAATTFSDTILESTGARHFACCTRLNKQYGLALIDITTGECLAAVFDTEEALIDTVQKYAPKEVLIDQKLHGKCREKLCGKLFVKEGWYFNLESAEEMLKRHFKVGSLAGFGLKPMPSAICAAGSALTYLQTERALPLSTITRIERLHPGDILQIDQTSTEQLEILTQLYPFLNRTATAMGARKLRRMLLSPFQSKKRIDTTQERIASLEAICEALKKKLSDIRDIERLIGRVKRKSHGPRDLAALGRSLKPLPEIREIVPLFRERITCFDALVCELETALAETLPVRLSDGGVIRKGYNAELDQIRELKEKAGVWLSDYQKELRERTGCKTLKVGFNKAFGYFIEVTRRDSAAMPPVFHKKQTLTNTERFLSPELKTFEEQMYQADEKIEAIEKSCFETLTEKVQVNADAISEVARVIAYLDAINALAIIGKTAGYVFPKIEEARCLDIVDGRHPLVEEKLGAKFIPNTLALQSKSLMVLTGPNMGGKSTYIKQMALIVVLAHLGCRVPAKEATIGLVDQIFSRIGASDDLMGGRSTFMVEMTETASIVHNATERSFVILDEIGRGTSTYDGVSIAWAVCQELVAKGCYTLFATHYFELIDLESEYDSVINCHVSADEGPDGITFLHKIEKGGADKSYGIHVASLAGLPERVIDNAERKLKTLGGGSVQLELFEKAVLPNWVNEIKEIDLDQMRGIDALLFLEKISKLAKNS